MEKTVPVLPSCVVTVLSALQGPAGEREVPAQAVLHDAQRILQQ